MLPLKLLSNDSKIIDTSTALKVLRYVQEPLAHAQYGIVHKAILSTFF